MSRPLRVGAHQGTSRPAPLCPAASPSPVSMIPSTRRAAEDTSAPVRPPDLGAARLLAPDAPLAPAETPTTGSHAHTHDGGAGLADDASNATPAPPGGERARRIRAMFAAIAPAYDLNNHLLSAGTDIVWRRRVVTAALHGLLPDTPAPGAAPAPPLRVLDVCTGTGDLALAFARRLGPRGEVTGADFTEAMLEIARRKAAPPPAAPPPAAAPAPPPRPLVDFVLGDAMRLPFPDAAFDVATVAFGIRNVADPAAGLAEMARVVRPGGRVVVLEFSQPPRRWFRRLYYWYFFKVLPRLGGWISGRTDAYGYLAQSVVEFDSVEALADKMRAAGLASVRWTRLTMGIAAIHVGEKH